MSDEARSRKTFAPIIVKLAAGTYYWCACGESQHQPFCDGSHRALPAGATQGEAPEPLRWRLEEEKRVALCTCKRTATPPYCDGSHS